MRYNPARTAHTHTYTLRGFFYTGIGKKCICYPKGAETRTLCGRREGRDRWNGTSVVCRRYTRTGACVRACAQLRQYLTVALGWQAINHARCALKGGIVAALFPGVNKRVKFKFHKIGIL